MYCLVILLKRNTLNTMLSHMGVHFFFSFSLPLSLPPFFHSFFPLSLLSFLSLSLSFFFLQILKNQGPSGNSGPLHCHLLCLQDPSPRSAKGSSGGMTDGVIHSFTVCFSPPETRALCLPCLTLNL